MGHFVFCGAWLHQAQMWSHLPFAGFFAALKRMITNPAVVLITLGATIDYFTIAGSGTFIPKYFEVHFGQTPTTSNIAVGENSHSIHDTVALNGFITNKEDKYIDIKMCDKLRSSPMCHAIYTRNIYFNCLIFFITIWLTQLLMLNVLAWIE